VFFNVFKCFLTRFDSAEWRWKIVPGERTGVWERSLADLSATTRLIHLAVSAQTGPHLVDGDGTHCPRLTQHDATRALSCAGNKLTILAYIINKVIWHPNRSICQACQHNKHRCSGCRCCASRRCTPPHLHQRQHSLHVRWLRLTPWEWTNSVTSMFL